MAADPAKQQHNKKTATRGPAAPQPPTNRGKAQQPLQPSATPTLQKEPVRCQVASSKKNANTQHPSPQPCTSRLPQSTAARASAPPAGLVNHGNTCFASAALQAIGSVPALTNVFITHRYAGDCQCPHGQHCSACLLGELFAQVAGGGVVSPLTLLEKLPLQLLKQRKGRQEDAQEFLVDLLDLLSKDLDRYNTARSQVIGARLCCIPALMIF